MITKYEVVIVSSFCGMKIRAKRPSNLLIVQNIEMILNSGLFSILDVFSIVLLRPWTEVPFTIVGAGGGGGGGLFPITETQYKQYLGFS